MWRMQTLQQKRQKRDTLMILSLSMYCVKSMGKKSSTRQTTWLGILHPFQMQHQARRWGQGEKIGHRSLRQQERDIERAVTLTSRKAIHELQKSMLLFLYLVHCTQIPRLMRSQKLYHSHRQKSGSLFPWSIFISGLLTWRMVWWRWDGVKNCKNFEKHSETAYVGEGGHCKLSSQCNHGFGAVWSQ